MPEFTDQIGRTVVLPLPPSRIISLVPSQTELLYSLGADVAGITKFCIHPGAWFRNKPRVGGTKKLDFQKIDALRPDLIIANKEENDRGQVESLARSYPVWVSDVNSLSRALDMISMVGDLVGRSEAAATLAAGIADNFSRLSPCHPLRTAYLIWQSTAPLSYMAAGGDTFINDMLVHCGFINHYADHTRYPAVSPSSLEACDLVLLSSEPYPFRDEHRTELQTLLPEATIHLVDGQFFSWYGSRLLGAPGYFNELLSRLQQTEL